MSIFKHEQVATDFSPLMTEGVRVNKWLPTNLDGVTERLGQFLLIETKTGEPISVGQQRMLKAFAALPQFTVVIVNCEWLPAEKGARLFKPESFSVMGSDGSIPPAIVTSTEDFASRYETWCRQPKAIGRAAWESGWTN